MKRSDAENRIDKLREVIEHHRYLYHVLDKPEISDEAVDSLKKELIDIENQFPDLITPDSPSQRVSGQPLDKFEKVKHKIEQWSFNDIFNADGSYEFDKRVKRSLLKKISEDFSENSLEYTVELKIDGLKIVLEYEKGLLVTAATRGDGKIGENVTTNVKTIGAIPLKLKQPLDLIVEGEIFLSKKDFERLNKNLKKSGKDTYANPRNLAAGTIRQLDSKIVAERNLSVFIYEIARANNLPGGFPKTQYEELEKLQELGFKVNSHFKLCSNIDEVINFWKSWHKKKDKENYQIDGVVIKINRQDYQKALGYTGNAPRFAIALKFPAEQVTTIVEDINFQVGRTGVITPVAHLQPIEVAGSIVSRATLHNEDEINRLDIRIGDTVILQKAGDVIPQVVEVLKDLRPPNTKEFKFPKKILECGGDGSIERIPGQSAYRCVDKNSFTVQRRKLHYFVSKNAFDIENLGPKVIDQLVENNLVTSPVDIFTLKKGDLLSLDRFAEKSADNLLWSINSAREVSLARLIVGLSIDNVGEETAVLLANKFKTIKKLASASLKKLIMINGVGDVVAESIFNWFRKEKNIKLLGLLLQEIKIQKIESDINPESVFTGKTIVLTGTLSGMSRDEAKKKIRSLGGSISSSVSKNTDFVVAGDSSGMKLQKAKQFGIAVLSEKEFNKLV